MPKAKKAEAPSLRYTMPQVAEAARVMRRNPEVSITHVAQRCSMPLESMRQLLPYWAQTYPERFDQDHRLCKPLKEQPAGDEENPLE